MIGELMAMNRSVGSGVIYVDDVFSTYLYTGNGSTQTITNGIDLAGKDGLVWIKGRSGATQHALYDTVRGATKDLISNDTGAENTRAAGLTAFNQNGFSTGSYSAINTNAATYASWTFRKAPKFFDVVTFTTDGSGVASSISHSLGQAPGMIVVKTTGVADNWYVYHASLGTANNLKLNLTNASAAVSVVTATSASSFSVGNVTPNAAHVAYLFAHDTTTDGIIQCGSFTTDGSGNATVNLGWEPQWLLVKRSDGGAIDWYVVDSMRGFVAPPADDRYLNPNLSAAENTANVASPTATGFTITGGFGASQTFIYLAIRRPNKPPTSGTQVYNAIARTGTGAAATVTGVGFAPDLVIPKSRGSLDPNTWVDRLRGATAFLLSSSTNAEATSSDKVTSFEMDGVKLGADASGTINANLGTYINWFFRRAPGVFDVVCYTGTGGAITVNHSLGVVPELIIIKNRSGAENWGVWYSGIANNSNLKLNLTDAVVASGIVASTVTSTTFAPQTYASSSNTYVAYLFATLPGISKVGRYTGNGSSQTINCGFSAGARFVLIKRTNSTGGDWYVWDSVRGIVAANDPHLSLNTTAAEVTTDDSIDPDNSGFIVNQVAATNINVNAASYIFLSFS